MLSRSPALLASDDALTCKWPCCCGQGNLLPFTFADILLMLGLALAAGFFIFVFVNPPEALINWITGKNSEKESGSAKGPAKNPDKR